MPSFDRAAKSGSSGGWLSYGKEGIDEGVEGGDCGAVGVASSCCAKEAMLLVEPAVDETLDTTRVVAVKGSLSALSSKYS